MIAENKKAFSHLKTRNGTSTEITSHIFQFYFVNHFITKAILLSFYWNLTWACIIRFTIAVRGHKAMKSDLCMSFSDHIMSVMFTSEGTKKNFSTINTQINILS